MSGFAEAEDVESIGQTVKEMTAAVHAQTQVLQDLAQAMNRQHVESARATGGRVEMHVNGGGLALWGAVTMCAVMLVATFFLGVVVLWFAMRTNDQGHQMNAMYQSVPGLRELVDRQMKLIDRTNTPPKQDPKK